MFKPASFIIALIFAIVALATVYGIDLLPLSTRESLGAGVGMVLGVAVLAVTLWRFPALRPRSYDVSAYHVGDFWWLVAVVALISGVAGYRLVAILSQS